MANTRRSIKSDVVKADEAWLTHIKNPETPTSQCMFTSESYYTALWEHLHHGILIVDQDGEIIEANRKAIQILKTTGIEIEDCNLKDIIPAGEWDVEYGDYRTVVEGKTHEAIREMNVKTVQDKFKTIPVRLVTTRIPWSLTHPFQHTIIHLYPLVSTKQLQNLEKHEDISNQSFKDVIKEYIKTNGNAIIAAICFILLLIFLSGSLGNLVTDLSKYYFNNQTQQQEIEKERN